MLKLVTGMRTNNSGFTLIEILVVVVILGITASFALMAFGDFGKHLRVEAEATELTQQLKKIHYQAILDALPYRIDITPKAYQIFRFTPPDTWQLQKSHPLHFFSQDKQSIIMQASGEITPLTLSFGLINHAPITNIKTESNGIITLKKKS